tara:strand:- start:1135 stop:1395 length:261 start_codon:yes stop_codon:yes gene_type:complete
MLMMVLNKLTAIVLLVCSIGLLYHISRLNKIENKKVKSLQNDKNRDTIRVLKDSDELRDKVIDELSRQKLVFSSEEGTWLRRRQID